jgi:hypothetical protein
MPDGRPLAERKCPTALATMAEEERRYDSIPPHLWRRPSTLADLERKIATVASHLGAIDAKIADGADLAYWRDCRARTEQQLAIYREAHSALMTDALARSTVRGPGALSEFA